jgi:hypothetical protein
MTLTVRSASVTGATTASRSLTHAEMDANWAHFVSRDAEIQASLAASTGAALVGFVQSGTGATSRTMQAKAREIEVSSEDFSGATLDVRLAAAVAAMPSTGGRIKIPDNSSGYTLAATVTISKPIHLDFGNADITCPASGFGIDVTSNDSQITGTKRTRFVMTTSGSGAIRNNQTQRCTYKGFKIDPNNVQNQIAFHHNGGWYLDMQDVEILKDNTHSTTDGIRLTSTDLGVPGDTGSYGGAFVSTYKNIVAKRVRMSGAAADFRVTTITFETADIAEVIESYTLSITFVQPVIQQSSTGGYFFDLDNVTGHTCIGGDFEGNQTTVYKFTNSCRGIQSINNTISGSTMTYTSGTLPSASYFMDDDQGVAITGQIRGYVGATQPIEFQNTGWTEKHSFGIHQAGDTFEMGANLKATSSSQGNLANTGAGGALISIGAGGTWKIRTATAGANPRTLEDAISGDTVGNVRVHNALTLTQGAQADSANNLVLGADGNRYQIAGTTQINLIANTNWTGGTIVVLHFQGAVTVKHNQAASGVNKPIMLAGAVDFSASANDQLTLQYDSTDSKWYEIARTVI